MTVTKSRSGMPVAENDALQDQKEAGKRNEECEKLFVVPDLLSLRLDYKGKVTLIQNTLGAQYLAELLLHPGQSISAEELFHRYHDRSDGQQYLYAADETALAREGLSCAGLLPIAMTDAKALREIHHRLKDVRNQLNEKAQWCDSSGLDELYREEEHLENYLKEVISPKGKIRNFSGEQRRLKESVSRSLRRAIGRIKNQDAELGDYLQKTVHCWDCLCFEPECPGSQTSPSA